MNITVNLVFELQVMNGSIFVAGKTGKNAIVNSVGIIDRFDPGMDYAQYYPSKGFLTGELMLSAYFITFPMEEQCACIRFLHKEGASGIILYHVGLFSERIHPAVIQTAEDLAFPIIQLPTNRRSYSDLITAIMKVVLHEQKEKYYLPSIVLEQIAQLPDNKRTQKDLLNIISRFTHLSIGLYDRNYQIMDKSIWSGHQDDLFQELTIAEYLAPQVAEELVWLQLSSGYPYSFSIHTVAMQDAAIKYLVIVSEYGPPEEGQIEQIHECLRLYFLIWGEKKLGTVALCQALRQGEILQAKKLAKILRVNINNIRAMLVFFTKKSYTAKAQEKTALRLVQFFSDRHCKAMLEFLEDCIVAFIEFPHLQISLREFTDILDQDLPAIVSFTHAFLHAEALWKPHFHVLYELL